MSTFTAEDQSSAEVCRRRLAGCDVYVGIIGFARGTIVEDDPAGRSFVEFEFDIAHELGLPRIVLVWENVLGRRRRNRAVAVRIPLAPCPVRKRSYTPGPSTEATCNERLSTRW